MWGGGLPLVKDRFEYEQSIDRALKRKRWSLYKSTRKRPALAWIEGKVLAGVRTEAKLRELAAVALDLNSIKKAVYFFIVAVLPVVLQIVLAFLV